MCWLLERGSKHLRRLCVLRCLALLGRVLLGLAEAVLGGWECKGDGYVDSF